MVLSVYETPFALEAKFISLLTRVESLLPNTDALHEGASITRDLIKLEVVFINMPCLKAV